MFVVYEVYCYFLVLFTEVVFGVGGGFTIFAHLVVVLVETYFLAFWPIVFINYF